MSDAGSRQDSDTFLAGGGEMGALIRALDWSTFPLGVPERWPQSLRAAVSICLGSRFPIVLYWGPQLVTIYNDAYAPILARKHPWALGRPCQEVWAEIWHVIEPMLQSVMVSGEATWSDDQLLLLERHGYAEECYFSFSFSPVRGESGGVDGIFTAVIEHTRRVIGERRVSLLRELAASAAEVTSDIEACEHAASKLSRSGADIPFALIYLRAANNRSARLAAIAGLREGEPASPREVNLDDEAVSWPLAQVEATVQAVLVTDLGDRYPDLPGGPWNVSAHSAYVLPIPSPGHESLAGFLVAGLSPRRAFDEDYRAFLGLVASHAATAIADARALEAERARAEALAEIDRAKTAFFSNVSHEFRTPLTLMLGPIEDLLAKGHAELSPAARAQIEVVHRNGLRLLRLVNTLLDFSRIEAGRVRAAYEPTDLPTVTADLASVFRTAVERAGLRLLVDCPPLGSPVFVDRDMWEKIVLNLVSNAFKFTFDGEIEVGLRQTRDAAELRVRDTGTGIPAAEMPRLFERFHRIENARRRTHEGSGIGLALVQELVHLHGGSITAESVLGQGTTFTVTVPLGSAHLPPDQVGMGRPPSTGTGAKAYVDEALRWLGDDRPDEPEGRSLPELGADGTAIVPSSPVGTRGRRPRVLVADDNADMRQYVARLLGERYAVETVADGRAALVAARERPPDLILADVMMPQLDGFGLLRELRDDPRTRHLPVIMLSARAGEESRVEGLEAGADDYLVKPFGARELGARVLAHLQLARLRREAEASLRQSEESLRLADRRKDEFLATLAHELRGPLAPLRSMLEVLKRADEDRDMIQQARSTMDRQLHHLTRLVDDLLDVSRITRGSLTLQPETVELAAVVAQAVDACRPLAESARHRVTVSLPSEPIHLQADPVRLAQVLGNLLGNACKYTDPGGEIALSAERQGPEVVIRVTDTGVGISPDHLDRIFEMFTQLDRSLETSRGGLGIGLTLVKRLVELHGGTTTAHSDGLGRGSEFVVRLPALGAERAAEPVAARGGEEPRPTARRVLVVDDNPDSAAALAMLLDLGGQQTRMAHDGLEAVKAAEEFRPDLVFLDIGLPTLNGYDACRRIREQPWGKEIMLVALSGWGREEDQRRSREAGFDLHLVKPVDYTALAELLAAPRSAPA